MKCIIILVVFASCVVCASASEYFWGEIGPKDYLIAKDKVTKLGFIGLMTKKSYIFKQNRGDPLTITAIRVTDRKSKYDSTCELKSGGIGSKGVKLAFKAQKRARSIKSLVEIWGR